MNRKDLLALLELSGTTMYRLCRDLRIAHSTAARWGDKVPGYAVAYAYALTLMTEEQRAEFRKRMDRKP